MTWTLSFSLPNPSSFLLFPHTIISPSRYCFSLHILFLSVSPLHTPSQSSLLSSPSLYRPFPPPLFLFSTSIYIERVPGCKPVSLLPLPTLLLIFPLSSVVPVPSVPSSSRAPSSPFSFPFQILPFFLNFSLYSALLPSLRECIKKPWNNCFGHINYIIITQKIHRNHMQCFPLSSVTLAKFVIANRSSTYLMLPWQAYVRPVPMSVLVHLHVICLSLYLSIYPFIYLYIFKYNYPAIYSPISSWNQDGSL